MLFFSISIPHPSTFREEPKLSSDAASMITEAGANNLGFFRIRILKDQKMNLTALKWTGRAYMMPRFTASSPE